MKEEVKLTPISPPDEAGRYYKNTNEPRLVGEVIKEVLTPQEQDSSLESLIHLSILLKRELQETPIDKRSALAVNLWEFYKEHCGFWESYEDFINRIRSENGSDWMFRSGII